MRILVMMLFGMMCVFAQAQESFHLISPKKNSFKFDLSSNLVIIPVTLNGVSLSFLLDTGVKETMLFVSEKDSIPLENVHKMKFSGIGIEDGVEGIMALNNELIIGDVAADFGHDIYVINSSELDVSSHVGLPVHGILGSKFFESFQVKLDYQKSRIYLFDFFSDISKETKGYKKIDISLERSRPYAMADVNLGDRQLNDAKMLIDMGNSDGMLIFPFLIPDLKIKEPHIYDYIGRGFNGEIFGMRNRIEGFDFAGFHINQPIVSYPDSNAVHAAKLAENRVGSVGNQVLQHFHVVFDYSNLHVYLKPNRKFGKPFPINMSGIEVKHDGMVWTQRRVPANINSSSTDNNEPGFKVNISQSFKYEFRLLPIYVISNIRKDSPADLAGLLKDDVLLKIDGKKVGDLKLKEVMGKFQEKDGKPIHLLVRRLDKEMSFRFVLKDPIPFRKEG